MNIWGFSPFPDCSICKRWADDGGWLDNVNYRFWVCLDCDDYLDEIERPKEEKMNNEYDECPTCGRTMFTELCGYCEGQIGVKIEEEIKPKS